MQDVLNLLSVVLAVSFVILRRSFTVLAKRPLSKGDRRRPWFVAILLLTYASAAAFVGLGLWQLATSGYLPVAVLLAVFLGLLLALLRREVREKRSRASGS